MVTMDAGYLGLLLHPDAEPPKDPATNDLVTRAPERLERLVDDLNAANDRVVIPTPALCEFLVLAAKDGPQYLGELMNQPGFYIRAFDQMAAIELAAMELMARRKGNKRSPAHSDTPWQKVKFDRQIVAIAKAHQSHTIFSDDDGVRAFGTEAGIKVIPCWELPLPESKQPLLENLEGTPIELNPVSRKIRLEE